MKTEEIKTLLGRIAKAMPHMFMLHEEMFFIFTGDKVLELQVEESSLPIIQAWATVDGNKKNVDPYFNARQRLEFIAGWKEREQ
jgi:hypothetical protein